KRGVLRGARNRSGSMPGKGPSMKTLLLCSLLIAVPVFAGAPATTKSAEPVKADAASKTSKDDEAIKATFANFDKAFNTHDAKLMTSQFLENGTMVSPHGDLMKGRGDIQKHCEMLFAAPMFKDMHHEVTVTSITYIRPD